MIALIKQNDEWLVSMPNGSGTFFSIEAAANYMVDTLGVNNDSIDDALIEMLTLNRNKALFNDAGYFANTTKE